MYLNNNNNTKHVYLIFKNKTINLNINLKQDSWYETTKCKLIICLTKGSQSQYWKLCYRLKVMNIKSIPKNEKSSILHHGSSELRNCL